MKYVIDREHKYLFETSKSIEFDNLVTNSDELEQEAATYLAHLLHRSERSLSGISSKEKFLKGRTLFEKTPALKRAATSRGYAEIIAQLTLEKKIRFGFAQIIWGGKEQPSPLSLQQTSIFPVIGAVLLSLSPRQESEATSSLFSTKEGSGVFFSPEQTIDFSPLEESPLACYLLIAYTNSSAIYREEKQDPLGHFLLSYGYTYGDRLMGPNHPLLVR